MTDFDSQIEGMSNARVGIVCHRDTWGLKVKEACNRAGITNVTKIYTELSKVEHPLDFDIVFIAEDYYSNVTGGELLDSLLSNKKLRATTAIVMVGNMGETVVHNYDSAIILLDFLPQVFSQAQFEQITSKMLLAQRTFFGVLSFVSSGRLAFAYKTLTNLDKSRVAKSLIHEFCKLQVNLAFELGKYKKVLSICDNPKLQQQDWTVWPRFKANYELGNWQYCQDSIQKRDFTALPAGPMKLFWQLRILIEQDKFTEGLELLEAYPKKDMSLSMIRLAFSDVGFRRLATSGSVYFPKSQVGSQCPSDASYVDQHSMHYVSVQVLCCEF
jgi:RNase P protein component